MHTTTAGLICLVIGSHGRRVQTQTSLYEGLDPSFVVRFAQIIRTPMRAKQHEAKRKIATSNSFKTFARLLLAFNMNHMPTLQRMGGIRRTSELQKGVQIHQYFMKDTTGEEEKDINTGTEVPLLQLLEERQLGMLMKRAYKDPSAVIELILDAGTAGIISAAIVYFAFYSMAALIGEVVYHTTSGQWLDPRVLIQEDTASKVEALALIGAWYLVCKPFVPLRIGAALLLTPTVKRLIDAPESTSKRPVQRANSSAVRTNQETTPLSSEDGVIERLTHPETGQRVTLIGTMHLSASSNAQVARELRNVKPDVVVIEMDQARLPRLGMSDTDFAVPYRTSDGIMPPLGEDDTADAERAAAGDGWWWRPARAAALKAFARTGRLFLSGMYDKVGASMGGGLKPGGEFVEAIRAANELGVPCVLADRESVETLTRVAELALRSGNPWSLPDRVAAISEDEYTKLIASKGTDPNEADIESVMAAAEDLKKNPEFRERMTERMSAEVPEIGRALIDERDYIMAEAINRELANPSCATHVCAVVGAGHLKGMKRNLEDKWQQVKAR